MQHVAWKNQMSVAELGGGIEAAGEAGVLSN